MRSEECWMGRTTYKAPQYPFYIGYYFAGFDIKHHISTDTIGLIRVIKGYETIHSLITLYNPFNLLIEVYSVC